MGRMAIEIGLDQTPGHDARRLSRQACFHEHVTSEIPQALRLEFPRHGFFLSNANAAAKYARE